VTCVANQILCALLQCICVNCRCSDNSASSACAEKAEPEGPSVKKHATDMMAVALERKKKLDKDKKKTLKRLWY